MTAGLQAKNIKLQAHSQPLRYTVLGGQLHLSADLTSGACPPPQYPVCRRLGGPQNRYWHDEEPASGTDAQYNVSVASDQNVTDEGSQSRTKQLCC